MWRALFRLTILYVMIDGFIVNFFFIFPVVHLIKDVLIITTYVLFFLNENAMYWLTHYRERIGNGAFLILLCFFSWGIFQIFNPLSPGLLRGILGFKVFFLTWPLMILSFAYVRDFDDVIKLMRLIVYVAVPINLFGLFQFFQEPEFMANTFGPGFARATIVAHIRDVRAHESFIRVFGTFASSGQYSNFLIVNTLFSIALFFSTEEKIRKRIYMVCLLLSFVVLLATGSRGGLLTLSLSLGVFLLFGRSAKPLATLVIILGIGFYIGFNLMGKNVGKRFSTISEVGMIQERTVETTSKMFFDHLDKYPIGQGLGAGSTATRYLGGFEGQWQLVESFLPRLQFEMGSPGVVLFYLFVIAISYRWVNLWLARPPNAYIRACMVACAGYGLVQLLVVTFFGSIDSPPTSYFLWIVVGIAAKLSYYSESSASSRYEAGGFYSDQRN